MKPSLQNMKMTAVIEKAKDSVNSVGSSNQQQQDQLKKRHKQKEKRRSSQPELTEHKVGGQQQQQHNLALARRDSKYSNNINSSASRAQKGASFLDRLHEVANLIATTQKDGHKSLFKDPPLPLITSNKFSLEPDIAQGWRPDKEFLLLSKTPSLVQFKSVQDRRFSSVEQQEAQAERATLLGDLINGDNEKEEANDSEEDKSSVEHDSDQATQQERELLTNPLLQEKNYAGAEKDVIEGTGGQGLGVKKQIFSQHKNSQGLGFEPEPDPLTPSSDNSGASANKDKMNVDINRKTKQSFLELAQRTNFDQDDLYATDKNLLGFKSLVISKTDQNVDTAKVPLLASNFDPWITQNYIKNSEKYLNVYERSRFKNSQDLLYHNLKMKQDPLLARQKEDDESHSDGLPPTQNNESQPLSPHHLKFDSEYESGNLELAYLSKTQTEQSQKYILLLSNDYNSNGHHQWFNFKVSKLKEETVYEFELGPFKKQKSQFEKGMLPWMCDLCKTQQKQARFPFHKNVAAEYISDLKYLQRPNQDGKSMSFLTFRLFIPRISTEYANDRQFLISYSEPYTYSRLLSLLTELKTSGLAKKAKWLNFKVGKLCNSLGGIPLPLLKLVQKQNETILSVYQKPIILISARVHPGEPPGSFLCEGLLRALLNPLNERTVERLLSVAEIHIVPMLNPDGVIIGNSRVNLGGVDMNRRWGANVIDSTVTPEVSTLKDYMSRYRNQILMYLDLHGHTQGEGIFFYACQPKFPKPNKDKTIEMSVLEKFVLVQALPTATAKTSKFFNLKRNKYFSYKKDKVGNKLGTARVVSLYELGIELSYTIECSFWQYITKQKQKVKRDTLNESALMQAGADLLTGIYNVTFTTLKLKALNKSMLQFLSQKKTRLAGQSLIKQDLFLESHRPLFNGIFAKVKKKFAKAMQIRLMKQLQQIAQAQSIFRKTSVTQISNYNDDLKNFTNQQFTNNQRLSVNDMTRTQFGEKQINDNKDIAAVTVKEVSIIDNMSREEDQEEDQAENQNNSQKDSSSQRAYIPLVLGKQKSDYSLRSFGDDAQNAISVSKLANAEEAGFVNLRKISNEPTKEQISQILVQDEVLIEQQLPFGDDKPISSLSPPSKLAVIQHQHHQPNQTMSSLPSFAQMEARFSMTNQERGNQKMKMTKFTASVDERSMTEFSSQESEKMSGSESQPSEDNMDQYMLDELSGIIKEQNIKIENSKRSKKKGKLRNQSQMKKLQKFEKNCVEETQQSIRLSIESVINGHADARSKSQLADIQTRNHDSTLFNLNNLQTTSNSFIPTKNIIQGSQKQKRMRDKAKLNMVANNSDLNHHQDSNVSIGNATQRNNAEQAFRITERMSSIYSKQFLPDPTQVMMDQQNRMDTVLQNRSRNFQASKNLTTPSLTQNISRLNMNSTARQPHNHHSIKDNHNSSQELSVLGGKTQMKFGQPNRMNSLRPLMHDDKFGNQNRTLRLQDDYEDDNQLKGGFNPLISNASSNNMLPTIKLQMQINHRKHQRNNNIRSSSVVQDYSQTTRNNHNLQTYQQKVNLIDRSISDAQMQWKAVPTTLSTFKKKESFQNRTKSVFQVPLHEIINKVSSQSHLGNKKSLSPNIMTKYGQISIGEISHPDLMNAALATQQQSSRFKRRRATQEQPSKPLVFNQMRVIPAGQRPNNQGAILTGNKMTTMQVIEQLAIKQREENINNEVINTQKPDNISSGLTTAKLIQMKISKETSLNNTRPNNTSQRKQSQPQRRVIKINQMKPESDLDHLNYDAGYINLMNNTVSGAGIQYIEPLQNISINNYDEQQSISSKAEVSKAAATTSYLYQGDQQQSNESDGIDEDGSPSYAAYLNQTQQEEQNHVQKPIQDRKQLFQSQLTQLQGGEEQQWDDSTNNNNNLLMMQSPLIKRQGVPIKKRIQLNQGKHNKPKKNSIIVDTLVNTTLQNLPIISHAADLKPQL